MDEKMLEDAKKQHFDNYKNVIIECINNNTSVLIDEDIMSLMRKPPLDSMDLLKQKIILLAKKNDVIINTDKLSYKFDSYRSKLISINEELKKIRIDSLNDAIKKCEEDSNFTIYKLNKKEFNSINKNIKKIIKDNLEESFNKNIIKNFDSLFSNVDDSIINNISESITKYYKSYKKQLIDSVDIKILVKDTTLINTIKEHSDRYLFTLNNSRLFSIE